MNTEKMKKTGQWWTDSLNPTIGCTPCSDKCLHCYAKGIHDMRHKAYLDGKKLPKQYAKPFSEIQLLPERLEIPLHHREPRIYFVDSMGDLFHKDVPFDYIDKVMAVIALCPQHTFLICTKRIERAKEYFDERNFGDIIADLRSEYGSRAVYDESADWLSRFVKRYELDDVFSGTREGALGYREERKSRLPQQFPLSNLYLGCTPENYEDVEKLLQIPTTYKFISLEPLLKNWKNLHISLASRKIDWVIVGAETGPNARYCPIGNIESVVEQCNAAGVPVWTKSVHLWKGNNGQMYRTKDEAKLHCGESEPKMKIVHKTFAYKPVGMAWGKTICKEK